MKTMKWTSDAFLSWRTESDACNFEVTFPTFGVYILAISDGLCGEKRNCSVRSTESSVTLLWPACVSDNRHPQRLANDWPSSASNRNAFEVICWCFLFPGTQTRVMIKPRNEPLQEHSCHQDNRLSWRLDRNPSDLHSDSTQFESRPIWLRAFSSCKFLIVVKSARIACCRTGPFS